MYLTINGITRLVLVNKGMGSDMWNNCNLVPNSSVNQGCVNMFHHHNQSPDPSWMQPVVKAQRFWTLYKRHLAQKTSLLTANILVHIFTEGPHTNNKEISMTVMTPKVHMHHFSFQFCCKDSTYVATLKIKYLCSYCIHYSPLYISVTYSVLWPHMSMYMSMCTTMHCGMVMSLPSDFVGYFLAMHYNMQTTEWVPHFMYIHKLEHSKVL